VFNFCGIILWSFFLAFFATLAFETPFMLLQKIIVTRKCDATRGANYCFFGVHLNILLSRIDGQKAQNRWRKKGKQRGGGA
jgi:hypothetical protein